MGSIGTTSESNPVTAHEIFNSNSYQGAYMSFVTTKKAKSITVPGVIKEIDNVMLASQWLMGPGGLPTAAAMGKFAAWRIIKRNQKEV